MFEEVFFRFRLLLHGFVFAEAVASALDAGGLDGKNEVVIVLAVEVRHETLLAGEALVDQQIFFVVAHRVAEIHVNDLPTVTRDLVADHPVVILAVSGIIGAEGGGIVEVDRIAGMRSAVTASMAPS